LTALHGRAAKSKLLGSVRDSLRVQKLPDRLLEKREAREGDWVFRSRSNRDRHRPARRYGRFVDERAAMIGLDPGNYGAHNLRHTKVTLI
jgi:integrase